MVAMDSVLVVLAEVGVFVLFMRELSHGSASAQGRRGGGL